MVGVDQLAAQLDRLLSGEVSGQAGHAPAHPPLRFVHLHAHTRLAQAPRSSESGDAGADDYDFLARWRHRTWQLRATAEHQPRSRALQQAPARVIDAEGAALLKEFIQRRVRMRGCACDARGALQQREKLSACHPSPSIREVKPFAGKTPAASNNGADCPNADIP
ncbi:hypothetical protein GCM10027432_07760 [Lysobacter fragariae]